MNKNTLSTLSVAAIMAMSTSAFAKKKPSDAQIAAKAKQEYVDMTAACKTCEEAVKTDSIFGTKYKELLTRAIKLNTQLKGVDMRHTEALKILKQEVDRGAYHGKAGVKKYKKRLEKLESDMNSEKEKLYVDISIAYAELIMTQKSSYEAIVERRVQEAIIKR